jgi:hypothetical protein
MAGRERLLREPAGQMRESGGSSTGHNRETTGRAHDPPSTEGRSPAPPPLTDHTKGRSPAPPPLTDHTKGRSPAPPPLTDHTKGRSPAPPPLTDHTKGRSPAPPPLTDHTKGRSPAPPHPPEGAAKAGQIEPVSLPGQGLPARRGIGA